ncbi:MAG: hypothetical protein K2W85_17110 [Phycisphaerales bacterium]|nr:hypothetical protein [Phycisphaerales bacterium]
MSTPLTIRTRRSVAQLALSLLIAACTLLSLPPAAHAQKSPNAIIRVKAGDEFRYVYRLETDETLTQPDKSDAPATSTKSIQEVQVHFKVASDAISGTVVDATFETFRVWIDMRDRMLMIDVSGPTPPESDPAALQMYTRFRPLVGITARLNVSVAGEITQVTIPESIKGEPAWPVFRRYLDKDLFRTVFGPVFTLKSDGPLLNIGEPWYYRVHAYARAAECGVWETRTLQGVVGGVASINGVTRATGKPEDFQGKAIAFLDIDAKSAYAWNVERARLIKHTKNDTIRTRFTRDTAVMHSDLIGASTLTLKEDDVATTPASLPKTTPSAPQNPPAPSAPTTPDPPATQPPAQPAATPPAQPKP